MLRTKRSNEDGDDSDEGESDDETEASEANKNDDSIENYFVSEADLPYRHMPCVAHTLQLLINPVCKNHYRTLLVAARKLVSKIRKSSTLTQDLQTEYGRTVIADCPTRWNSTYQMVRRLLEIRHSIDSVLAKAKHDTLRNKEWERLQELISLLQPFAEQTDVLQSDGRSLSLIIPALLDLEAHLLTFPNRSAARVLLDDFKERFSSYLQPDAIGFNPLPAAASFLDPTVAGISDSHDT